MTLTSLVPNADDTVIELDRDARLDRQRRGHPTPMHVQPLLAERRALAATLGRALASMTVRLEPFRDARGATAYVAAVRTDDQHLPHVVALLRAAEKLGVGRQVRERLRSCLADGVARAPAGGAVTVALTIDDLDDAGTYDPDSALARVATRVVLRIHDVASAPHAAASLAALSGLGFRIHGEDERRTLPRNAA